MLLQFSILRLHYLVLAEDILTFTTMGVAESKVVAHQVLLACQRAENEGKIKIDHDNILWKDEVCIFPSLQLESI